MRSVDQKCCSSVSVRSVVQHCCSNCRSAVSIRGADQSVAEVSIRSVAQKIDQKKCRSEVLLRSVDQKCRTEVLLRSVAQTCFSEMLSEVRIRSVNHNCQSKVLLGSFDQKCSQRYRSLLRGVAQKCRSCH